MGNTQKLKAREKLAGQALFIFFMFFLNSADPTISEPGTGYLLQPRLQGRVLDQYLGIGESLRV